MKFLEYECIQCVHYFEEWGAYVVLNVWHAELRSFTPSDGWRVLCEWKTETRDEAKKILIKRLKELDNKNFERLWDRPKKRREHIMWIEKGSVNSNG